LLRVTHERYAGATALSGSTNEGRQIILSGLKTLIETGEPLVIEPAAPARASRHPQAS
jgi:hypothetical protein